MISFLGVVFLKNKAKVVYLNMHWTIRRSNLHSKELFSEYFKRRILKVQNEFL